MAIAPDRTKLVFRKTERALVKLSSKQDAANVHQLRTSVRRLQTLLQQILAHRDRNQRKLLKILSRIRKRAGRVRDVDVQLAALRSLKVPQEPRRKAQLMQALAVLRLKHEEKLRKLLRKDEIREIRKRLRRASKMVDPAGGGDALQVGGSMLNAVIQPDRPITEDRLHDYRTVVKRARYAAEFAPKSVEATAFIRELKVLQDALGEWHDCWTLTETASKRLGEVNQSPLVAVLRNLTRIKFRHAVAAISASAIVSHTKPAAISAEQPRHVSTTSPTLIERIESAA